MPLMPALRDPHPLPARPPGILPVMKIGIGLDARLRLPVRPVADGRAGGGAARIRERVDPGPGHPDSLPASAPAPGRRRLRYEPGFPSSRRRGCGPRAGPGGPAATLAQLSAGRFVLGLGTGGYGPGFWASVGLPDRPIAVMREYVTEVRGLLAGQQVNGRPDHRQGRLGSGRARVAAVRLIGAGGSAAGSGLPRRAGPRDAPARRARSPAERCSTGRRRPARRGTPGADRRGRGQGRAASRADCYR